MQFSDAMFLSLAYTSARHACTHLAFVEGEFCSVENVLRKTSRNELPTDHGKIVADSWVFSIPLSVKTSTHSSFETLQRTAIGFIIRRLLYFDGTLTMGGALQKISVRIEEPAQIKSELDDSFADQLTLFLHEYFEVG